MKRANTHQSQLKGRDAVFGCSATSVGSFSRREKVRMRGTRSKTPIFHSFTLALSRSVTGRASWLI
jgi:hypothetical protein